MFFTDHGTPNAWRNMHGYGCHTFRWWVLIEQNVSQSLQANAKKCSSRVNASGQFVYIKYHFIADHGQKQFTADEAIRMCGEDPDYSKRDLYAAIERGEKISWTAYVQIMKPEEAVPEKLGFDPFDVTKIWPRRMFPVRLSLSLFQG
jgi:catalase